MAGTARGSRTGRLWGGAAAAVFLLAALAIAVTGGEGALPDRAQGPVASVARFDAAAAALIASWQHPGLTGVMQAVTRLGDADSIIGICAAAGLWLARQRRWRDVAHLWLGAAGAAALVWLAKLAIDRPRPAWPHVPALTAATGPSFPSGHALLSLVVAGLCWMLLRRGDGTGRPRTRRPAASGVAAVAVAALLAAIGCSRVYLGVHYPTDVLGGWLGGLALLAAFAGLRQRYERRQPPERMQAAGKDSTIQPGDTR